jgi:hypothetical protein
LDIQRAGAGGAIGFGGPKSGRYPADRFDLLIGKADDRAAADGGNGQRPDDGSISHVQSLALRLYDQRDLRAF